MRANGKGGARAGPAQIVGHPDPSGHRFLKAADLDGLFKRHFDQIDANHDGFALPEELAASRKATTKS